MRLECKRGCIWLGNEKKLLYNLLLHPEVFDLREFTRYKKQKAYKPGLPCGALGNRLPLLPSGSDGIHGSVVAQDPGL